MQHIWYRSTNSYLRPCGDRCILEFRIWGGGLGKQYGAYTVFPLYPKQGSGRHSINVNACSVKYKIIHTEWVKNDYK